MYHQFTIILSFKTINKSWKTNILIIGTVFNNWLNSSHQNRRQSLRVARPCRCLYMFIQNNLKPNVFNNLNELVCKAVLLILKVGSHRLLRLVLLLIFSSRPISSRFIQLTLTVWKKDGLKFKNKTETVISYFVHYLGRNGLLIKVVFHKQRIQEI